MRGSAGSAAAPAARWRNLRRGSFMVPPVACSAESLLTLLPLLRLVDDLVSRASEARPGPRSPRHISFLGSWVPALTRAWDHVATRQAGRSLGRDTRPSSKQR